MNNYFSKKLYVEGLKKIRVSGIAFLVTFVVLNMIIPLIMIISDSMLISGGRNYGTRVVEAVDPSTFIPFSIIIVALMPLIMFDMFSFLNKRNESDFYHSLPQKRECVYVSFVFAALTWAAGTIITSTLVNAFLWGIARYYTFSFSTVILAMLPYLVLAVLMAGVTALAMSITGTKISNVLVAILVFLFLRIIGVFFVETLGEITNVLDTDYSFWRYLGFEYFLPARIFIDIFDSDSEGFRSAGLLIYTLLVGALYLFLGGVGYKKRNSEMADRSAPNRLFQNIYRCAVTLPFVLAFFCVSMVDGEIEDWTVIWLVFALLVFVLYELMTTKKVKNTLKSMPLILVPIICAGAISGSMYFVRNQIYKDTPSADRIDSFSMSIYNRTQEYEEIKTKNVWIESDEASVIIADALKISADEDWRQIYDGDFNLVKVKIKLDSGRVLARRVYMPHSDRVRLDEIRYGDEEYSEQYLLIPAPDTVTRVSVSGFDVPIELYEEYYKIYNSLPKSIQMNIKRSMNMGGDNNFGRLQISGTENGKKYYTTLGIYPRYMTDIALEFVKIRNDNEDVEYLGYRIQELRKMLELSEKTSPEYIYSYVDIVKMNGTMDSGSSVLSFNGQDIENLRNLCEIAEIILSSGNPFDGTDIDKLYRISFNCEIHIPDKEIIIDYNPNSMPSVKEVVSGVSWENTEAIAVPEKYIGKDYFYCSFDGYVFLEDAAVAEIVSVLGTKEAHEK